MTYDTTFEDLSCEISWVDKLRRWTRVELSTLDRKWRPLTAERWEAARLILIEKEDRAKLKCRVTDVSEGQAKEKTRWRQGRGRVQCALT